MVAEMPTKVHRARIAAERDNALHALGDSDLLWGKSWIYRRLAL
jgi:hypothetical protein